MQQRHLQQQQQQQQLTDDGRCSSSPMPTLLDPFTYPLAAAPTPLGLRAFLVDLDGYKVLCEDEEVGKLKATVFVEQGQDADALCAKTSSLPALSLHQQQLYARYATYSNNTTPVSSITIPFSLEQQIACLRKRKRSIGSTGSTPDFATPIESLPFLLQQREHQQQRSSSHPSSVSTTPTAMAVDRSHISSSATENNTLLLSSVTAVQLNLVDWDASIPMEQSLSPTLQSTTSTSLPLAQAHPHKKRALQLALLSSSADNGNTNTHTTSNINNDINTSHSCSLQYASDIDPPVSVNCYQDTLATPMATMSLVLGSTGNSISNPLSMMTTTTTTTTTNTLSTTTLPSLMNANLNTPTPTPTQMTSPSINAAIVLPVSTTSPPISMNFPQVPSTTDQMLPPSPIHSPSHTPLDNLELLTHERTYSSQANNQAQTIAPLLTLTQLPDFLSAYDTLPNQLQSYILFHILRRSSVSTLQFVSSFVQPALKRNFLGLLPYEIAVHILKHLDYKTLCRCARTCKRWRTIVDGDIQLWRTRGALDRLWDAEGRGAKLKIRNQKDIASIIECGKKYDFDVKRDFMSFFDLKSFPTSDSYFGKKRFVLTPATPHPYKHLYRRLIELRRNWREGRHRTITFTGHANSVVTCLQFDEEKIVSGSDDQTICVYDIRTGRLIRTLEGHEGGVWALQYVDDTLVSGSTDRSVRVWDLSTGECTHVFGGHTSTVRCLQILLPYSMQTSQQYGGYHTSSTYLTPPLNQPNTLSSSSSIPSLANYLNNSGNNSSGPNIVRPLDYPLIVTGSRDTTLRVWKLPDLKIERARKQQDGGAKYQDDNSDAATRAMQKSIRRHTTPHQSTHQQQLNITQGNGQGQPSHIHHHHLSGDDDDASLVNPYFMHSLTGHIHSVRALAGNGNIVCSGSYDHTVRVWDVVKGECLWRLAGHSTKVYSIVFDGRSKCWSGSMDSTVRCWDLTNGNCISLLEGHTSLVGLLEITPEYLISAAADSSLRVWDPRTNTVKHTLQAHTGAITCFQYDNHKVVSGSEGMIKLWDLETGKVVRDLVTNVANVWRVQIDQRWCVAAVNRNERTEFVVLDFDVDTNDQNYDHTCASNNSLVELVENTNQPISTLYDVSHHDIDDMEDDDEDDDEANEDDDDNDDDEDNDDAEVHGLHEEHLDEFDHQESSTSNNNNQSEQYHSHYQRHTDPGFGNDTVNSVGKRTTSKSSSAFGPSQTQTNARSKQHVQGIEPVFGTTSSLSTSVTTGVPDAPHYHHQHDLRGLLTSQGIRHPSSYAIQQRQHNHHNCYSHPTRLSTVLPHQLPLHGLSYTSSASSVSVPNVAMQQTQPQEFDPPAPVAATATASMNQTPYGESSASTSRPDRSSQVSEQQTAVASTQRRLRSHAKRNVQ